MDSGGSLRRVVVVDSRTLLARTLVDSLSREGFAAVTVPCERSEVLYAAGGDWETTAVVAIPNGAEAAERLDFIGHLVEIGADVLLLAGPDTDRLTLAQGIVAGGLGYASSEQSIELLVGKLRAIAAGRPVLSAGDRSFLLDVWNRHVADLESRLERFRSLTERETIVLSELMEGRQPEDIASGDYVAVATVRTQIKSIFKKLGVHSQVEAVAMAYRAGWEPQLQAAAG